MARYQLGTINSHFEPSEAILNDHGPMKILEATNTNGAINSHFESSEAIGRHNFPIKILEAFNTIRPSKSGPQYPLRVIWSHQCHKNVVGAIDSQQEPLNNTSSHPQTMEPSKEERIIGSNNFPLDCDPPMKIGSHQKPMFANRSDLK